MHTLLPLTESTTPGGARGGECKQSRDSCVKLMPVQKAQIVKYALASGNNAAILLRYTKEFQTEINCKKSSVSMRKAKYICARIEALRNSSGNGSRDVAVLPHHTQL